MSKLTAEDLARAISELPRHIRYSYINPTTTTKLEIEMVELPEGPVHIRRYDPNKGSRNTATRTTISNAMLWRVANAVAEEIPINIDRIVGASYNNRSALETLLAHTPEFYVCRPDRIEITTDGPKFKRGHKHLIWRPSSTHRRGRISRVETRQTISEVPTVDAVYESLVLPDVRNEFQAEPLPEGVQRRHAQIQIRLVEIGRHLGFKTWVASNDRGIIYNNKRIGEMDGVVIDMNQNTLLSGRHEAIKAALLIDCVWFRNAKLMPAVIEVEHSTGVRSGLARMNTFRNEIPAIGTKWVIAAADEDRNKVLKECNDTQFQHLDARFFSYSAIEELHALCARRKIRGVTDEFLDCFMERCLPALIA